MANQQQRTDRFTSMVDEYVGYTVRDRDRSKIGKVDDLFLDEDDRPQYISVKMGFFGTRSTLIPLDACTVDEGRGFVEVNKTRHEVKEAPNFDDDGITPDYERRVRDYYGLGDVDGAGDRGVYDAYYDGEGRDGVHEGDGTSSHGSDGRRESAVDSGEVSVPVVEEEVVGGKQAVVKEEIRVRKDVVQDEEVIEEDVRKEEVDIDDASGLSDG